MCQFWLLTSITQLPIILMAINKPDSVITSSTITPGLQKRATI